MADRTTFNGASTNVPWTEFGDQYARHVKTLYDASALPLTNVSGTPNDVTAQVDPVLSGVLVDGMKFTITWASANTGPMTLRVNTSAAIPVLMADGSSMIPNSAASGTRSLIEFIGGSFRILSGSGSGSDASRYFWRFTASGTWQKPAGLPDDAMVVVEMWGGGGGGTSFAAGGGGGAYGIYRFRAIDIPASVPVSIGAGGTGSGPGGRTDFGALAHTYGGGGSSLGGGGAGEVQGGLSGGIGGAVGGGDSGSNAKSIFGGGGQGGGHAVFGGAGGGGISRYGGDGGTTEAPGQAPGGGGGPGTNGARGEVRIWI